jgi:Tol biopolymer transport system component
MNSKVEIVQRLQMWRRLSSLRVGATFQSPLPGRAGLPAWPTYLDGAPSGRALLPMAGPFHNSEGGAMRRPILKSGARVTRPSGHKRSACLLLVLASFCLVWLSDSSLRAGGPVRLGSFSSKIGVSGAGNSMVPSFSADGRFLVFLSQANNLVTNDDVGLSLDVFALELATGKMTLVSVSTNGWGGANADAADPSASSDGRYVAFASAAGNLVANDTNLASDIFVRDLQAGSTVLASADTNGAAPAAPYPGSTHPLVSADGSRLFFESTATTLTTAPDGQSTRDVFVRDLASGITRLVSVSLAGGGGLNRGDDSELCSITPDGRFATFVSKAPNLVAGAVSPQGDVFVRDVQSNRTFWAGTNLATLLNVAAGSCRAFNAVLSVDGHWVVFKATGSGTAVSVFRHDLISGQTELLASQSRLDTWPDLSADGRFIAFEDGTNVYVRDVQAGTNACASVATDGTSLGGTAIRPVLTPDGHSVAFMHRGGSSAWEFWVRDLQAGITRLASVTSDGRPGTVEHENIAPALSPDGLHLAFDSGRDDWVTNDLNKGYDIFLRDLAGQSTRLVSQRHPDLAALSVAGNVTVNRNCLSADGRILVFSRLEGDLWPAGQTNNWRTVYARDLLTGDSLLATPRAKMTANVSVITNGQQMIFVELESASGWYAGGGSLFKGDLASGNAVRADLSYDGTVGSPASYLSPPMWADISSDGRYVVFTSSQSSYVQPGIGSGGYQQVFLRDLVMATNYLLSANWISGSTPAYGNASSSQPIFSPDGRWVAFQSLASNLASNYVTSPAVQLYVRDLQAVWTRMVSRDATSALGCTGLPVFSPDSSCLVFASSNPTSGLRDVYLHDLASGTNLLVATNGNQPYLSQGGSCVVYQTWQPAALGPFTNQVMVCDLSNGVTSLASVNLAGTGGGNRPSSAPVITPDGRYVVFASLASDLVADDRNGVRDIFVRDLVTSNTLAVTRSRLTGGTGNGFAGPPILGADGRTVIFQSFAGDLGPGDYNDQADVFLLRLGNADSDHDGMDDDWEMAYFPDLSRDGTGDQDQDGMSDLDEFRAGTDPTNQGSVLRTMTLYSLDRNRTTLLWPAVPGKAYKVQFKDEVAVPGWTDLDVPVSVDGTTGSVTDPTAKDTPYRFYRVLVLP